jgi:NAD(P)-dependent dehydrogenase (short-subunit alcohol dehydrogenase family)
MSIPAGTGQLAGKVAIVTGAASGIGAATVRRLVAEGADVVAADRNPAGLAVLASKLGDRVLAHRCDVTREEDILAAVDAALDHFGGLHVIHSNAVAALQSDTDVVRTPDADWQAMFTMVVMASVWLCRHGIPAMRSSGGGSIINMSSGAAHQATGSKVAYGTAKGALETLSIYTAGMYGADGIRCNVVSPGFVLTEGTRQFFDDSAIAQFGQRMAAGRVCMPEDVADVVAFLASDAARYVNGQVLTVNGGGSRPAAW